VTPPARNYAEEGIQTAMPQPTGEGPKPTKVTTKQGKSKENTVIMATTTGLTLTTSAGSSSDACRPPPPQTGNDETMDRGRQRRSTNHQHIVTAEGEPTTVNNILPRYLLQILGRDKQVENGKKILPHH